MFYLFVLTSISISFIYWFKKNSIREFFLFWYIVFLPTTKLLPDINIPGFRFEILFGIGFLIIDFFSDNSNDIKRKLYFKETSFARLLIILQAIFGIYGSFKLLFFPHGNDYIKLSVLLVSTTRIILIVFIFLRISYSLSYPIVRKTIVLALLVGFCLLGFSAFFYKFFANLGLLTAKLEFNEELGRNVVASTGLFRGHPTQFAGFLGTGFGFAFAYLLSSKKYLIKGISFLALMSCLLGVIRSSKRAGIIAFIVILLFYLFFEKQNISKKTIVIFAVIIIGIWGLFTFGDYILIRFSSTEEQLRGVDNSASRYAIWSTHIYYFLGHPEIWPIGVWWSDALNVNERLLSSHNTLLKYLVYAGIPFFIIFYKNIYNLFVYYFKNKKSMHFNYLYPLIGYLIPSTMNDNFDINYLPIMIALGIAFSIDNRFTSFVLKNWIIDNSNEKTIIAENKELERKEI